MGEFTCCLKQYRQRKGLTQEQLAVLVGVRRETIIRLESGRYNPSLKLAVSVSRAVEAPIDTLALLTGGAGLGVLIQTLSSDIMTITAPSSGAADSWDTVRIP